MDRHALFVDAGYLLAAGGSLCLATHRRAEIQCAYGGLHQALVDFTTTDCGLPILRTYWYDGAPTVGPHTQPSTDHLTIAALPNLKLRLGRLSGGRQKGVDALVMRDLMTLARERAISTAYLLGGDDDLREGVIAAQDMGVRVILIGVPGTVGQNQAQTLVHECDFAHVLAEEFWKPHFARPGSSSDSATEPRLLDAVLIPDHAGEEAAIDAVTRAYFEEWIGSAPAEVARLVSERLPMLPRDIDGPLLRRAETIFGSMRGRQALRERVRNSFVSRVEAWRRQSDTDS